MKQALPPLGTLQAFNVAAQCLSFTETAKALHITQAAVSHQIKALEAYLGKALFTRGNRSLALTEAGHAYLPFVEQMFRIIIEGTEQIRQSSTHSALTVSVLPSFAARWLVPRLGLFLKAHPEIDIRLAPSRRLTDFNNEQIDLAIRHGAGNYPDLTSIHILDEEIDAVCHPKYLQGPHALKTPNDLQHHVLLHDDGYTEWQKWLLAANALEVDASKGPVYTDSSMAAQSAIEGDGIALARSQLVKDDLARGLLVRPFDITQPSQYAYYVVYPKNKLVSQQMTDFTCWLQEQAAEAQA